MVTTGKIAIELRNSGYSFGLKYPLIYGKIDGVWLVWNRHSGKIIRSFGPSILDGYNACEFAKPINYDKYPVDFDSIP